MAITGIKEKCDEGRFRFINFICQRWKEKPIV